MNTSSDIKLLELICGESHQAYAILIDRYWEPLYRHIWLKTKNSDDAKDMVQEIFLGLWKNRTKISLDTHQSLAPYLFTAAKYAVINHFSRARIPIADEKALLTALQLPSGINTDDLLLINELQNLVENQVRMLPERLQAPYRLSREQDLPIREIAKKLSLSEQTVKNNISAALNTIRYKLGKYHSEGTVIHCIFFAFIFYYR